MAYGFPVNGGGGAHTAKFYAMARAPRIKKPAVPGTAGFF